MKTEKVLAAILLVGLILKFAHIPGGNALTILSVSTLSLVYLPGGFYFLSYKKIDDKTIGFSILSGVSLATLVIGILFRLMHWPGATVVLLVGLMTALPIAIISYLKYTKPKHEGQVTFYRNIFFRVMIFIILGLLVSVL